MSTVAEVADRLTQMADKIGDVYGVSLGLILLDGSLVFADDLGDPIAAEDGGVITAATADEVESGVFLQLFSGRALYAALALLFKRADSSP